jgi:hypothetical protein
MGEKKAPVEDGIPSEVCKSLVQTLTPVHNSDLQRVSQKRNFPKEVEKSNDNIDH